MGMDTGIDSDMGTDMDTNTGVDTSTKTHAPTLAPASTAQACTSTNTSTDTRHEKAQRHTDADRRHRSKGCSCLSILFMTLLTAQISQDMMDNKRAHKPLSQEECQLFLPDVRSSEGKGANRADALRRDRDVTGAQTIEHNGTPTTRNK